MVRVRFAGVVRLRKDGLVCGFWLKRRIDSPRSTKMERLGRSDRIYQFVLRSEDELDDEVRGMDPRGLRCGPAGASLHVATTVAT